MLRKRRWNFLHFLIEIFQALDLARLYLPHTLRRPFFDSRESPRERLHPFLLLGKHLELLECLVYHFGQLVYFLLVFVDEFVLVVDQGIRLSDLQFPLPQILLLLLNFLFELFLVDLYFLYFPKDLVVAASLETVSSQSLRVLPQTLQ